MTGYTKLFTDILTSTIWGEDDKTRIVWITMLALRDRNHKVSASIPGLARQANVDLESCEAAVRKLESPDPYSRSKEHEGRRIEAVDGGWMILNGEKYRSKMNDDERREYQRNKQAEYRKRKKTIKAQGKEDGANQALAEGMAEAEALKPGEGPDVWGD